MPARIIFLLAITFSNVSCAQKAIKGVGDSLLFSSFHGDFSTFIATAISTGSRAIIDKNVSPGKTIVVDGNLILVGRNMAVITNNLPVLFLLKSGEHLFENFNIEQQPGATAFSTEIRNNIIWTNTIRKVNVTGGRGTYSGSRGGLYSERTDSVIKWSGTIIEDCVFKNSVNCIGIFSQDGPAKYLHMRNVDLYCDSSHNIYVHPNVSLRFYNVRSMKAGKLALHHFSGGGGENGKGVTSNARYVEIRNCTTNWQPDMKGGMWEIAEPVSGAVIMDSCNLALYSIPLPRMIATNTRFFNGGGGALVKGKIINCSGGIWPTDGTEVIGGNFDDISLRMGGKSLIKNAVVKNVWGDRNAAYPVFQNCTIENMNLVAPYGKVVLKNTKLKKSNLPVGAGGVIIIEK